MLSCNILEYIWDKKLSFSMEELDKVFLHHVDMLA